MQEDSRGLASLQWTLTAYNIAFAAGIITAAAAATDSGAAGLQHWPRLVHCCLGGLRGRPERPALIAARTVQAGRAIILPLSLTILTTVSPPSDEG